MTKQLRFALETDRDRIWGKGEEGHSDDKDKKQLNEWAKFESQMVHESEKNTFTSSILAAATNPYTVLLLMMT